MKKEFKESRGRKKAKAFKRNIKKERDWRRKID